MLMKPLVASMKILDRSKGDYLLRVICRHIKALSPCGMWEFHFGETLILFKSVEKPITLVQNPRIIIDDILIDQNWLLSPENGDFGIILTKILNSPYITQTGYSKPVPKTVFLAEKIILQEWAVLVNVSLNQMVSCILILWDSKLSTLQSGSHLILWFQGIWIIQYDSYSVIRTFYLLSNANCCAAFMLHFFVYSCKVSSQTVAYQVYEFID